MWMWGARAGARGRGRRATPRLAAELALAVVASLLLGACSSHASAHTPPPATPAVTPASAPTPTPSPLALQNAARGCPGKPPAPSSTVVYTGKAPGSPGKAPNEVALTFDDGPTPYSSPAILSVLEQTHTPATFFVLGQYVHLWPNLVQREWKDGFAIGVHTWDHPMMSRQTVAQMRHQLGDTLLALHAALGPTACIWYWRPPYGDYNRQVLSVAASFGLTTIMWDDCAFDWTRPGVAQIVRYVLGQAHPGAIILMHDGPALREQTAAAIPLILQGLRARGLTPVTLPRLLADGHYPGVSVTLAAGSATPCATCSGPAGDCVLPDPRCSATATS
jgi:peptidoglycan/xylan/chitin deacetylase (PgdA/CDA1 family)